MSLLAGNWHSMRFGLGNSAIGALWSISVEEQFYSVWPGAFRTLSRRSFALCTVALGVVSLVATYFLARHAYGTLSIWLNSVPESIFFAAGGLLALLPLRRKRPNMFAFIGYFLAGVAAWFSAELLGHVTDRNTHPAAVAITAGYLLVALGCALVLNAFVQLPAERVPRAAIYLGKISYGLYVFHEFANHMYPSLIGKKLDHVLFGNMFVTFPLTLVLAALSYRLYEKPFLLLKRRFELVKTRTA